MRRATIAVAALWVVLYGFTALAADRMRIGYSSISGAYVGIWVAHDAGYFAKEGLDDQIILILDGTQLAQHNIDAQKELFPAAKNARPEQFVDTRFLGSWRKAVW